jgi:hypothetical protein
MRRKIFIVKTHLKSNSSIGHPDCTKIAISQLNFSRAIYILRNPYNAIAAEFNRRHAMVNKTKDTDFNAGQGIAPKEIFRTTSMCKCFYFIFKSYVKLFICREMIF